MWLPPSQIFNAPKETQAAELPISLLAGEMAGRPEGGGRERRVRR
ncbi:hypothetical protein X760_27985 [Mesorhizobium sp. LSHC422A00]|nr:hypothetical protein X760_27985 [Mesorhizobium sp. LSHC422A00]